jgi:hypothetical protein
MVPPSASTPACRETSNRIARSTLRSEFTFLVSVRVPKASWPIGRSDRLTSQRIEPCSMRTSETPSDSSSSRRWATYARATCGASRPAPSIGLVTISITGTPARL